MAVNWTKIKHEYENTDVPMSKLAKRHGVKLSTISSRKRRGKWQKNKHPTHVQADDIASKGKQREADSTLEAVDDVQSSGLNYKQQLFCLYYLQYFNATKSYRKAYGAGYDTARINGSRLLSKANIQATLKQLKQRQASDLYLNANDVLREYARQAFADVGDYVNFGHKTAVDEDTGEKYQRSYLYFKNDVDVDTSMIDSIHIGNQGAEIKLPDKQKALKELLDHVATPSNVSTEDNQFIKALKASMNDKKQDRDGHDDDKRPNDTD